MGSILLALSWAVLAANTITGTVYDNRRNPLTDVDVELLNDLGIFMQHSRTDTAGRYTFSGLADGRFGVRVMPFRYDFQEATREVTFSTFKVSASVRGSSIELLDFALSPRTAGLAYSEAQVIFAQEVPENARKAFQRAEASIKKKDLAGSIVSLEEAITNFPTYFLALKQLGEISFAKQDYGKSAQYFLRAADANNKSPKSLYMLGYSLYMLKMFPSADVALKQALL
jgi:tetratricopeptide (TPR) repeat protein